MRRTNPFGPALKAGLHYMKDHFERGETPDIDEMQQHMRSILKTYARHVSPHHKWSMAPANRKVLLRYWHYILTLIGESKEYYLRPEVVGVTPDLVLVNGQARRIVKIVSCDLANPLSNQTTYFHFEDVEDELRQATRYLTARTGQPLQAYVLLVSNDWYNWSNPIWHEVTMA